MNRKGGSTGGGTGGVGEAALDPEECLAVANADDGTIGLSLGDWPLDGPSPTVEASCTVLAIETAGSTLTTTLECAAQDTGPHTVIIQVGVPSIGSPDWAVDDDVELTASLSSGKGGFAASHQQGGAVLGGGPLGGGGAYPYYSVGVRRAQGGAFLLAATTLELGSAILAPLQTEAREGCMDDYGCGSDNAEVRLQYLVAEPGGDSVVVTGGRHAELSLQDGSMVVFDAPRAHSTNNDCHYFDASIAARRVTL